MILGNKTITNLACYYNQSYLISLVSCQLITTTFYSALIYYLHAQEK